MKAKSIKTLSVCLYIFWMIYATIDLRYDILFGFIPPFFYCLDQLNNAVKVMAVLSVVMYIILLIIKLICGKTNRFYDYFLTVLAAILIVPLFFDDTRHFYRPAQ